MKSIRLTLLSFLLLCGGTGAVWPADTLSLDSCRALALRYNKELRMADMRQRAAHYERKAAFTKYLPHMSASGAYLRTDKELSLLSDEQKQTLNHIGTTVGSLVPQLNGVAAALDGVGHGLVDALHTDTRRMGGVGVMMTQPLYMGGKIAAYNRITRYAEQIAVHQQDLTLQNVILEVDEAYWQIVSLQHRKRLAESYLALVQRLDHDLQRMIAEGVATQADGLSVKVKVNEAEVALIQVRNGLSLSQMLLCQLCGLELGTPIAVADASPQTLASLLPTTDRQVQTAFERRPELNALSLSTKIYRQKVRLARAEFLPTVALTGGYLATNPNVFNSFERQMKGLWSIGVVVNVPLLTWGERCYKVRAAQAEATLAGYQWEETREKVELQVNQQRQRLEEAEERLQTATRSRDEADENLRTARLGLREGILPVSNVLEAQTAWLSAHSTYVTAQIDLRLADLYLRKSVGTLSINH